jgi:hypothetical protein
VSEWGGGRVQVFNAAGGGVFAIFGGVEHAHHCAVDGEGAIYVSEYSTRRVKRFSLDGDWHDVCGESAVSLVAEENEGLAAIVTPARVVSLVTGRGGGKKRRLEVD